MKLVFGINRIIKLPTPNRPYSHMIRIQWARHYVSIKHYNQLWKKL